jgi:hypothetical protein
MIFNRNFLYVLCVLSASANIRFQEGGKAKQFGSGAVEGLVGLNPNPTTVSVDSRYNGSNDALANDYNIIVNDPWGG